MAKKVLITGKNSYIGTSFINYCQKNNYDIELTELDVHGDGWKEHDFSLYDAVINVAGIAHRKESDANKELYYQVNRDLAIEIAEKAKSNNVSNYIYLSTMAVYGNITGKIDLNTLTNPNSHYGISKMQAELKLIEMADDNFNISLVRPPMVYGKNGPGNYSKLSNFVKTYKVFPDVKNYRSMIHIDNLSEWLYQILNNKYSNLYFPQNLELIDTRELVTEIAKVNNLKIILVPNLFGSITSLARSNRFVSKVVGSLYYSQELTSPNYSLFNLNETVKRTEC